MTDGNHDELVRERLGTAPRPATALQDLAEWGRRHRIVAVLLGSLVFLSGALLVWWGQDRDRAVREVARRGAVLEEQLKRSELQTRQTEAARRLTLARIELPRDPTLALQLASDGATTLPSRAATDLLYRALDQHREVVRLYGHDGPVLGTERLPDGDRLLTWDETGLIQVWSLAAGKADRRHVVDGLLKAAWIDEGARIAATTDGGSLVVLEAGDETTVEVAEKGLDALVVLPGAVVVGGAGGPAVIVRLEDLEVRATLDGHEGGVHDIAADPAGRRIATIDAADRVRVWDASTGALEGAYEVGASSSLGRVEGRGRVAFLLGGDGVVAWSPAGVIGAWRLEDGTRLWRHGDAAWACSPFAAASEGPCIAFRRQRRPPETRDAEVWVVDVVETATVARFRGVPALPLDVAPAIDARATRVAIPVSTTGAFAVRALPSGIALAERPGGRGRISVARFLDDGRRLLLAGEDRTVRVLEVVPQPAREAVVGLSVIDASPDGRVALVGARSEAVRILDTATGDLLRTLEDANATAPFAVAADGSAVAYGIPRGGLGVVVLADPASDWTVEDAPAAAALAVALRGERVALRTPDGDLWVFDREGRRPFDGLGGRPFVLSPDGRYLAVLGAADGPPTTVFDLDAPADQLPQVLADRPCTVACFDPEGRHLVLGAGPGLLQKVVLETGEVAAAAPRGRPFFALRPSADGTVLLAVGPRWMSLHAFEDLAPRGTIPIERAPLLEAGFDPEGPYAVGTTRDGLVRLWPLDPLGFAKARLPQPIDPLDRRRLGVGTPDELDRAWAAVVALQPSAQGAFELGRARVEAGRVEAARQDAARARALRPDLVLGRYAELLVESHVLDTALPETPAWQQARAQALVGLAEILRSQDVPVAGLRADPLLRALWRLPEAAAMLAEAPPVPE